MAREVISDTSLAERAFRTLRSSPEALALEPWTPLSAGGRLTEQALVRVSGEPLDKPIPGLFTYDGFWAFFLARSAPAAKAALAETWLVVDDESRKPNLETITREMFELYYDEYIAQWQGMLDDLRVAPLSDTDTAAKVLVALSTPMKRIIDSTAQETNLAAQPRRRVARDVRNAASWHGASHEDIRRYWPPWCRGSEGCRPRRGARD